MPDAATPRTTIDMEAWVCPAPLRDSPNIVMGHGGGGAMSAELIEHLFLPAFGPAADAGMGDSAVDRRRRRRGSRSPPTPTSSSRWCSPAARSAIWRSTAPSTTSRWRARSRWCCPRRSSSRRARRSTRSARVAQAVGTAALAAGVKLVTGDTKVVDCGPRRRRLHQHRGHRPRRRAGRHPAAARARPATS